MSRPRKPQEDNRLRLSVDLGPGLSAIEREFVRSFVTARLEKTTREALRVVEKTRAKDQGVPIADLFPNEAGGEGR